MTSDQLNDSGPMTLDDALAECLREVERNAKADKAELASRFPQFRDELTEFLADWEQMEHVSCGLRGQYRNLRLRTPFGTNVGYFGDYQLLEEVGHGGMGVIF